MMKALKNVSYLAAIALPWFLSGCCPNCPKGIVCPVQEPTVVGQPAPAKVAQAEVSKPAAVHVDPERIVEEPLSR